jgi:hypothetical protein
MKATIFLGQTVKGEETCWKPWQIFSAANQWSESVAENADWLRNCDHGSIPQKSSLTGTEIL